jgi:hypothetical protein
MKNKIQFGMLLGLIGLTGFAYGQNADSRAGGRELFGTETHLNFILKLVDTNFNYGKSNSELADYKKPVSSLQAGLSFQGGITKRFSIVSELYFMMKGGKLKSGNPLTESGSTLRLYSVELPALAKVHFNRFHINAGPALAYNFTGRQRNGGTRQHVSFRDEVGGFKRWEGGAQFGGGYRFPVKGKTVTIDVRYHYGLTNISYDREIRNRYVNVSLQISRPWNNNPLAGR